MNRDKYAYVFLWVEYFWEQVPAFLKSLPGRVTNKKTRRITVSLFPRTFELTALLFKKKLPPPPLIHHNMYDVTY